jgi:peptidoglycan/LPS O-acetylase OafA/YrhL
MSTSAPKLPKSEAISKSRIDMNKPIPLSDASARDASFDYLRAFIVLLVLLHHSVLAYAVVWPAQSRTFEIVPAPIVDPQRWAGFDVVTTFNDTFFMALMFLLSGLFVWPSLERKGGASFLRERLLRLGLPFAVAVAILMPLAYYPSYAVTGADPGLLAYARAWLSLGFWPSGPAWFIWLLFVFDAVAAGLHVLRRRLTAKTPAPPRLGLHGHPPAIVATLLVVSALVVSALVYVPMELTFGAERWLTFGPFSFQASRLLLYATYFVAGIRIGASGTDSGFLARNAGLARQWPIWLSAGFAAYALQLAIIVTLVLPVAGAHRPLPLALRLVSDLAFVLSCGSISLACIALFRRFAIARHPVFDSLSASSYGMYLIHYPVVVWLQFAQLTLPPSPIAKGAIVYVGAVASSWGIVVALRRLPAIARVL